jgi:hypothetical protein
MMLPFRDSIGLAYAHLFDDKDFVMSPKRDGLVDEDRV